jgi:hypothetical protein
MPVTIICSEHYLPEGIDPEVYWRSKTRLDTPKFCSVLKCIGQKITYCRVKKQGEERDYLIPLCSIHGVSKRESEVYDYHLAPL